MPNEAAAARRSDEAGEIVIEYLRDISNKAELALEAYVRQVCPGTHELAQHQDGQPPWCDWCGRDDRGNTHK